jgi:predicted phosphate transport protein (TIGR00153 family)
LRHAAKKSIEAIGKLNNYLIDWGITSHTDYASTQGEVKNMKGANFFNIFASSPIKPIQAHMDKVVSCVELLPDFIACTARQEWQTAEGIHHRILSLESAADDLKREIRLHLPSSMFMPVNRIDLLELLTMQDKIASKAKHIASLVLGRKMTLPAVIVEDYDKFLARAIKAVTKAKKAIHELDELVDTGFRGPEVLRVTKMIQELDDVERETDKLEFKLRNFIFELEADYPALDVIFWYKLIDWTGELADRAQHVGYRLEVLLAQ